MASWRNVPATFHWDGESMTPTKTAVNPSPVQPVKLSSPVTATAGTVPGLTDEERLAALRTEVALDTILNMIPAPESESEEEEVSVRTETLWEAPVQNLPIEGSAIYPDGREIANANHLVLFMRRGAKLNRFYKVDGWYWELLREGGKKNPVSPSLVEPLVRSGVFKELPSGLYGSEN